MAAAQRMHSRPPKRRQVYRCGGNGTGGHPAETAADSSNTAAAAAVLLVLLPLLLFLLMVLLLLMALLGSSTGCVTPMTVRTASGRASKRPSLTPVSLLIIIEWSEVWCHCQF